LQRVLLWGWVGGGWLVDQVGAKERKHTSSKKEGLTLWICL
jgi:hypothetical protein